MKYIYGFVIALMVSSCSHKNIGVKEILHPEIKKEVPQEQVEVIADLQNIPQNITYYTKDLNKSAVEDIKSYDRNYFKYIWSEGFTPTRKAPERSN